MRIYEDMLIFEPKSRNGLIYSKLNDDMRIIGNGKFLPSWNESDFFNFVCQNCTHVAELLEIRYDDTKDEVRTLSVLLGCPHCGNTGQRNLNFDDNAHNHCFFHKAVHDDTIYYYGKEKKPEYQIKMKPCERKEIQI